MSIVQFAHIINETKISTFNLTIIRVFVKEKTVYKYQISMTITVKRIIYN